MSGRFYSDLLDGVDKRFGIDWTKDHETDKTKGYLYPSSGDAFKESVWAFKTSPKDTVSMELKKSTETQWKGASKTSTDKTAAKVKVNHDWADSEWSFCNDKFTGDVSGSNDDKDYPMKFTLKTESKPASNAWKVKLIWDASTPDFSGARFHENVEVQTTEKSDWTLTSKTNVDYQNEYSVGAHVVHDTKDFTKMRFQTVCSPDKTDSTFWIRADTKRECVGAGCDNQLKDGIRHSWEALYVWTEGFQGIRGQPVKVLGGVSYDLSKATSLTASGEFGENYLIKSGQTHKVDKNWTLGLSQRFDSSRATKDGAPYDIGFSMTYKL